MNEATLRLRSRCSFQPQPGDATAAEMKGNNNKKKIPIMNQQRLCNSPNIIQSDPETSTNASMSLSLSQVSRCRSGSELQHRLQQVADNLGD